MDQNKISLLDNYQIYQLIHFGSVDRSLIDILKTEFDSRDINSDELNRIKTKFENQYTQTQNRVKSNSPNPIFTSFLLKTHFQNIAKLKADRKKKEANKYQIKLNIGLVIEGAIVVVLLYFYYGFNK